MRVQYRIVEGIDADGVWKPTGAIACWPSDPPGWQLRPLLQHTVSRPIWREIEKRAREDGLSLANYEQAMKYHEQFYRLCPEILALEGDTAAEIRHWLQQQYVFSKASVPA